MTYSLYYIDANLGIQYCLMWHVELNGLIN